MAAVLASRAHRRLHHSLASSTSKAYSKMFRTFLSFCVFVSINIFSISVLNLMSFLEFLAYNDFTSSAIANHMSAVRTKFAMLGLNTSPFHDPRIKYFTESITLTSSLKVSLKSVIDIPLLSRIISQCDNTYMGQVFKAAYLLSFFSFLRISNLVPHTLNSFDPVKHLSRADVFFAHPGAHILITWSKTLQAKNQARVLKIPHLGSSPLCPVQALKNLLLITPAGRNKPLFQVKLRSNWVPLSDTRLRKHFKNIITALNLGQSSLTFHSFQRSGATMAFNSEVPIQDIQSHGTWTSDCVWSYITQNHDASDKVALAFQQRLLQ